MPGAPPCFHAACPSAKRTQQRAACLSLCLAGEHAAERALEQQVGALQVRREAQHLLRVGCKRQAAHVDQVAYETGNLTVMNTRM